MTIVTGDNIFGISEWIVDPVLGLGTHQTIQSAINSASSGDVIYVRSGTYTEDVTLKAGVSLTSSTGNQFPGVANIVGKLSASYEGTSSVSNFLLTTNSDFIAEITGSNSTDLVFKNCSFSLEDNTALSNTESGSSTILLDVCRLNCNTTGVTYWEITNGRLSLNQCTGNNSGGSSTSTTFSGGNLRIYNSYLGLPITLSGSTANLRIHNTTLECSSANSTAIVSNSSSAVGIRIEGCQLSSGSASAVSIGSGSTCTIAESTVSSSATNAITGSGVLNYGHITFTGTSSTTNVSTENALPVLP